MILTVQGRHTHYYLEQLQQTRAIQIISPSQYITDLDWKVTEMRKYDAQLLFSYNDTRNFILERKLKVFIFMSQTQKQKTNQEW